MEFNEVQDIWGAQKDQTPYRIDVGELHRRILAKKSKTLYITNLSELLILCVYLAGGIFILWVNGDGASRNFFLDCMGVWMIVVSGLVVISRVRRINAGRKFDRSVQGELKHALAVARYQIRLSRLMRWNIILVGGLILFSCLESKKSVWITVFIMLFFVLAWYASGLENRIYKTKKEKLEELWQKLES